MSAEIAPPAAPSLADLYAEKARRTAESNPTLSGLYAEKARRAGAPAPAAQLSALREPDPGTIDVNALPATSPQQSTTAGPPRRDFGLGAAKDRGAFEQSTFGRASKVVTAPTLDEKIAAGINTAGEAAAMPFTVAQGAVTGLVDQLTGDEGYGQKIEDTIAAPFRALDEHVAKPVAESLKKMNPWVRRGLSVATMNPLLNYPEAERAAINVGVPVVVGGAVHAGMKGLRQYVRGTPAPDISKPPAFDIPAAKVEPALPRAMPEKPAPTPSLRAGDRPIPPAELAALGDEAWQGVEPEPAPAKPAEAYRPRSIEEQRADPPLPPGGLDAILNDIGEPTPKTPEVDPVAHRLAQEAAADIGKALEGGDFDTAIGRLNKLLKRNEQVDFERSMKPAEAPSSPPLASGQAPAAPSAPDVPVAPPRGPTVGAGAPPPETPPAGPTLGAQSPKRPLTPGDARGAIRTQLSEKIDNLKGYSPDLFYKVKEALSLKSARTAKPVRDLQQALKNLTPEEAQGLTPAIMERRAQGTPAQNAFAEWWQNEHPKIREHLKSVGSRVVEKRDLVDLPETIPSDWNLKEIGPGKYLVTRPINAVPDFFPMRMSEVAREALKAGDPVVTDAIYGEGLKQGAWKDKAGFDQYLETYEAPNLKSTAAGLERPRKFRVPDEYREPDVVKTLNRYMHDVGQTSSEQSVFRYFDEKTGEARNPNEAWAPQGDLGDILGRLDPTERHAAERLSLDLLGRNPEGWAEQNRKSIEFSNRVGAVNALRLYGLRPTTAIVQLTQTAMTNSLVGTKATAKAVARFVMNPRAVYEEAVRSGAIRPHSQYADTIGVREQGAKGGGILNAASDLAMKPMAMTDLAGRLIASATAPDFAAQVGKQLQGNAWSRRIALKNLEALDYAPADATQFIKGLTPEQMDILRQRIVERTQGEVTNASRIPAATTPVGRVIMQGKNFGIAQARNTWRVAGKQLFQAGNPIPAAKLVVGAYLAGKGIAAAKDFLVGPSEKTRPDDALTALHEGSLGGYVGDVTYSAIRGKAQLSETLDRISDSQFAGLIAAIARAGYDVTDPPTDRKIATGQGPPIDIKKSRIDVLLNALQNAAPTGKEWVRIYNHFVGDDSIRKHEANAKALRELRKAQQGATLGAGAR